MVEVAQEVELRRTLTVTGIRNVSSNTTDRGGMMNVDENIFTCNLNPTEQKAYSTATRNIHPCCHWHVLQLPLGKFCSANRPTIVAELPQSHLFSEWGHPYHCSHSVPQIRDLGSGNAKFQPDPYKPSSSACSFNPPRTVFGTTGS
jgi:hypothetical protein